MSYTKQLTMILVEEDKETPQTCSIPGITLSTTEDPETLETCYALGCNASMTKSVDAGRFAEAL